MELKITDEKVRTIAEKHPAMKDTLKEVFPEAFPSEYLEFKVGQAIPSYPWHDVFIGFSFAPMGLSGKCLMWDTSKIETVTGIKMGRGYIAFKKLKP